MKAAREENYTKPLPVTPGSEPAQKELCPLGKASASGQESERISGKRKTSGNNSAVSPGVGDGSRISLGTD